MKRSNISYQESIARNLEDFTFEVGTPYEMYSREAVDYFLEAVSTPHLVVDLGCGDGAATNYLRKKDIETIGVDVNPKKIKSIADPKVCTDFMTYLTGLADNAIPSFFTHHALEHVPNPKDVLVEIARTLEPGGYFFVAVPYKDYLHDVHFSAFQSRNELIPDGMRLVKACIDRKSGGYWVISQK